MNIVVVPWVREMCIESVSEVTISFCNAQMVKKQNEVNVFVDQKSFGILVINMKVQKQN